jgi:hypothetical protein
MTLNPSEVLTELRAAGVTVTRAGDRLRLAPPQAVPAPLLVAVKENKSALLRLVGEPAPVLCFLCRGTSFWRGMVRYTDGRTRPGPWICRTCHPPAPGAEMPGAASTTHAKGEAE